MHVIDGDKGLWTVEELERYRNGQSMGGVWLFADYFTSWISFKKEIDKFCEELMELMKQEYRST